MTSAVQFPIDANTVRQFLTLSTDTTSRYSDSTISSNIRTAGAMLERMTHRYLAGRTTTLTFSTGGADFVTIPGLRTATSVSRVGAPLTVNASYYLLPDAMQSGLSTGISFGRTSWREPSYLGNPEWFDRNLDSPKYRYMEGSVPNDLVITGDWGFADATVPDDILMAVKELAAYLTKLGDSNMAGFLSTPDGNSFDLSNMPPVVQNVVAQWALPLGVQGA